MIVLTFLMLFLKESFLVMQLLLRSVGDQPVCCQDLDLACTKHLKFRLFFFQIKSLILKWPIRLPELVHAFKWKLSLRLFVQVRPSFIEKNLEDYYLVKNADKLVDHIIGQNKQEVSVMMKLGNLKSYWWLCWCWKSNFRVFKLRHIHFRFFKKLIVWS